MQHNVKIYKVIADGLIYNKKTTISKGLHDYNSLYDKTVNETNWY